MGLVSGLIFVGVATVLLGLARRPRAPEGEQAD
jgi:hypothetical protein